MKNQARSAIPAGHSSNLVFELKSIVEPIDLGELFAKTQPLEVELGCGDSSFLTEYAEKFPARNFMGVERLLGRIRKLDRKGRRNGLANLRGVRIESAYLLKYLLPKNSVEALHIYFPDPWPKRKHRRNRLINAPFTELAQRVLAPGGIVYLRTDDRDYFEQMIRVFGDSPLFQTTETPMALRAVVTDFEKNFNARGIETLRAAYQSR